MLAERERFRSGWLKLELESEFELEFWFQFGVSSGSNWSSVGADPSAAYAGPANGARNVCEPAGGRWPLR